MNELFEIKNCDFKTKDKKLEVTIWDLKFQKKRMKPSIIQQKIFEIRGQRVMLDFDLAALYEVETKVMNQAVKRNLERFPDDFMFQLTAKEWKEASAFVNRSQIVTSSQKHRSTFPNAFTEHGVTMLASVLRSEKAIQMNIAIVRAFIAMKEMGDHYQQLSTKIKSLEKKYNKQFKDIYEALQYLMAEKQQKIDWDDRERIGFKK
jgi:chromosome condensin MukBEF ATPase and DNA-binding subunit MukB